MDSPLSRRRFIRTTAFAVGAGTCFPRFKSLAQSAPASLFAAPGNLKVPFHGEFAELPLGSVKPAGWIKGWLQRQADGLSGHPENMAYPYDTCMFAGAIPPAPVPHGQSWWGYEQSGYFVDGATRLSHLIDNPNAAKIPAANLKYIVENSGPAKLGESTTGWPNAVVGRALMAEYSATGNANVAQALDTCILGSRSMGYRDGYLFEEAFYLYGLSGDARLVDFAKQAYDRYFVSDPKSFSHVDKIRGPNPLREHGVTSAEQLKLLPLMYCYTGDKSILDLANMAYRKVEADSLMPDGGIVSSERLGATAFDSLHETCDISDWSWSMGYLLMAGGEAHWGDRIEQIIFNALPGAVTKDFKQLQYFSSANQILASSTACSRQAPTRMSYRAAHETECCSGNVNRAMPNYVSRMWMRTNDGLAATLFGPSELNTMIDGHAVQIIQETDYPFRDTISFKLKLARPLTFTLHLRIPEWCTGAAIAVNGTSPGIETTPGTFTPLKREFHDGDLIALHLPMNVRLKDWFAGAAVSVERGPLVYSIPVSEKRVESQRDPEEIRRILKGNNIQGFPAVEFFPTGEWRYGIEAAQISTMHQFKVTESAMPENPFLAGTTPVKIELPLRALPAWQSAWLPVTDPPPANIKLAPKNPTSLPSPAEFQTPGMAAAIQLVPYGSTHLRITTLPVIPALPATSPRLIRM